MCEIEGCATGKDKLTREKNDEESDSVNDNGNDCQNT